MWNDYKKLDKKLVLTQRVKRFLTILGFIETINLVFMNKYHYNPGIALIVVLSIAIIISELIEEFLFYKYKKKAKKRRR